MKRNPLSISTRGTFVLFFVIFPMKKAPESTDIFENTKTEEKGTFHTAEGEIPVNLLVPFVSLTTKNQTFVQE